MKLCMMTINHRMKQFNRNTEIELSLIRTHDIFFYQYIVQGGNVQLILQI